MSGEKLGIFICECGYQIKNHLDLDRLMKEAQRLPSVTTCRRLHYACSPDGLATIQKFIKKKSLDRILVAGCTPRVVDAHFEEACTQCGIDGDFFELVDIREECAWAHPGETQAATDKALALIRMGTIRLTRPSQAFLRNEIVPAALVLGGGIAGMTAAINLADAGFPVKLVDRERELGGLLRHVRSLHPGGLATDQYLAEMNNKVTDHPRIDVLLETSVASVSGTVGRYTVSFHGNGTKGNGESSCDVGVILVATGADLLHPQPRSNHDGRRVVTQYEFEDELWKIENGSASAEKPNHIVMILCAQQHDGRYSDCTGTCFANALKQTHAIQRLNPRAKITLLFHDLYLPTGGDLAQEFHEAQQNGVVFMRFPVSHPPKVSDGIVEVTDELTGKRCRVAFDRVILPTPLVPQPDAGTVAKMLKIDQDERGFFLQRTERLLPDSSCDRGIYICGAAHYPCDWNEAEFQATNAAFRAIRHLRRGETILRWRTARVDPERCTGCGTCVETCSYHAITMQTREAMLNLATIDPWLCRGCGNCAVSCPVKAIGVPHESDAQIFDQIEAALMGSTGDGSHPVLVFGCEWSGLAAAEVAGARKLSYPVDTRLIRLSCGARFDPLFALWALFNGANGVLITACRPGKCHYIDGNQDLQARVQTLQQRLIGCGYDPRRLRLEWISPDDPVHFVETLTEFTNLVRALGPIPIQCTQNT